MTDISHTDRSISFEDGTVELPAPIKQIVEIDGLIVIRIEVSEKVDAGRNVWAFGSDATVLWEIEPAAKKSGKHQRFTNIWVEDGELWAYNWNGLAYRVDVETGDLREHRQMK